MAKATDEEHLGVLIAYQKGHPKAKWVKKEIEKIKRRIKRKKTKKKKQDVFGFGIPEGL